jgi:Na+-transporting NADH:ubiquinone oxidoreductase subunit NqrC
MWGICWASLGAIEGLDGISKTTMETNGVLRPFKNHNGNQWFLKAFQKTHWERMGFKACQKPQ